MARKPTVAIVGAGNLATSIAVSLRQAGYIIELIVARSQRKSQLRAQKLARQVEAHASAGLFRDMHAEVVWFCVPDSQIAAAATSLAQEVDWKDRVALHSSGALSSDELSVFQSKGAAVGSVHPLMTFVPESRPSLAAVPFAIEGDSRARRVARQIVKDLGGEAFSIQKANKAAYHAWGTFASPLFTALLATTEQVASRAGVRPSAARRRMIPILLQTLANYASLGAAGAFSGPIIRGDVDTVRRHLGVLQDSAAGEVYRSLVRAALQYLPAKNRSQLKRILDSSLR